MIEFDATGGPVRKLYDLVNFRVNDVVKASASIDCFFPVRLSRIDNCNCSSKVKMCFSALRHKESQIMLQTLN